jgi:outer membrane protein OmpA-like peptidoglycan-associated protein
LSRYADLQSRLDKLKNSSSLAAAGKGGQAAALTQGQYLWAKAQCWVRNAYSEQHERDASGFAAGALTEAQKIIQGLESSSNNYLDTPLIDHSTQARPDLWSKASTLKQHPGYACAAASVACLEVQLARSGHELNDMGWRNANSYLAIAEDMATRATQEAEGCIAPPPPPPPPAPPAIVPVPPEPVKPTPPAPVKTIEKVTLNASALFRFDKRTQGDLLPQGKAELDQLAERLKQVYASVETIDLVGHTDRLGSDAYNDKLSMDRANTVKAYLQSKGVTANMNTQGKGKADPIVQCPGGNTPAPALTQCLQPNRRVEITIVGVKK